MTKSAAPSQTARPVAIWLMIGVGMIIIQILLGGITRLTGSGLSITEWNVVTGVLPPLNHQQWLAAFDKYRQTPQFQLLNFDFTLSDFKFIFFWEWFHRIWARLMGFVFAIPFTWFLVKGYFRKSMVQPLVILFLLGALQGLVGWIMVQSGLTGDAVYVAPTRLALHFVFALGLLSYTFWFALDLMVPRQWRIRNLRINRITRVLLALLLVQLVYGALMAGHRAATAAPTWPDINGYLLPPNMFPGNEGFLSLLQNKITIQFVHRGLAYLLLLCILWLTISWYRMKSGTTLHFVKWIPLGLVFVQVVLGILSVYTSPGIVPGRWGLFEWMAQIHQLTAMLLLLSLVAVLFLTRRPAGHDAAAS